MPSVYEIITEKIIKQLESGVAPWRKPWTCQTPANLVTQKEYRGLNVFTLASQGLARSFAPSYIAVPIFPFHDCAANPISGEWSALNEKAGTVNAKHGTCCCGINHKVLIRRSCSSADALARVFVSMATSTTWPIQSSETRWSRRP